MKRGARLAVLAVALAVLVGAWLLAESMTRHREEQQAVEAMAEETSIGVGPAEDVSALSWNYLGDTVSLAKRDGQWVNIDDETCPINQEAVQPLVQAVAEASASSVIADVTDFGQFGLAEPAITVLAAAGDRTATYEIGNLTVSGEYYVRVDGSGQVYAETGKLAPAFQAQLDGLLALESPPEMARVTGLTVETAAGDYTVAYRENGGEFAFTDAYTWFRTGETGEEPLDEDQVKALYELASKIKLLTCVTWNAQDMAEYGLDQPQGTAHVVYLDANGDQQIFTLLFGDYTQDGYVYTCIEGSKMVYLVSGTVLDGLMYPDWTAMTPMNIAPLNWAWLQSFVIQREGERYEIVRSVAAPDVEGGEAENVYTQGDRSLDPALVDSWLDEVYGLTADSTAPQAQGREELMKLTFRQAREACPTVTLELWTYDSARCLCAVNGEGWYFVSRTAAMSLWDDAQEFLVQLPGDGE